MNIFPDALNWTLLFFSLSGMAFMLRSMSRKLGDALKVKKYYLLYDVSIVLFAISAAGILLSYSDGIGPVVFRLLFLAAALLMVGATVRYWGWIVPEMLKANK